MDIESPANERLLLVLGLRQYVDSLFVIGGFHSVVVVDGH